MLAINSTKSDKKFTPNILPCAIKHNGPVSAAERYWNPSTEQDGTTTAFFRGRKLRGKKVVLPEGYEGVVLQKTDKKVIAKPSMPIPGAEDSAEDSAEDAPKEIETMTMDQHATFGELMVWDHEAVPEGADVYVKGIEEWIGFAEAVSSGVHCFGQNCWLIVTV
jgi:ribonuclease H2 subunit C